MFRNYIFGTHSINEMSYFDKREYNKYASLTSGASIQPGGLLPIASQGCKSTIGGRQFTSYIPNCKLNGVMRRYTFPQHGLQAQLPNPWGQTPTNRTYRLGLQRNALRLMNSERQAAVYQAKEHCRCDCPGMADKLFNRNQYPQFNPFF